MRTIRFLSACVLCLFAGTISHPLLGQETPVDTVQLEKTRVDTVYVEKVKVDTVFVEKAITEPQQSQIKEEEKSPRDPKAEMKKSTTGGMPIFRSVNIPGSDLNP